MRMTRHSKARMEQRLGIRGSEAKKVTRHAAESGFRVEDTKGELRDYMMSRIKAYDYKYSIFLYSNHIYIFDRDVLITVYQLPETFISDMRNNLTEDAYEKYRSIQMGKGKNKKKFQEGVKAKVLSIAEKTYPGERFNCMIQRDGDRLRCTYILEYRDDRVDVDTLYSGLSEIVDNHEAKEIIIKKLIF